MLFMQLPSFTLSPEVEVTILTLQEDERVRREYKDVFTIIVKRKSELGTVENEMSKKPKLWHANGILKH